MFKTGLFPGPGGKGNFRKYPVWDERYCYDAWIEPCVAAGHQVHKYLAKGIIRNAFVADIDPKVAATWQVWSTPSLRSEVAERINRLSYRLLSDPVGVYEEMKAIIDGGSTDTVEIAAASLVGRQFVFGNTLRSNAKGQLNVCASKDKTRSLLRRSGVVGEHPQLNPGLLEQMNKGWRFEMPYFDSRWNVNWSANAHACIDAFEASSHQRAIAFFDPPYWVPRGSRPGRRGTGALTPAYTHHGDPQGDDLFTLCVSVLERLLSNPNIERVVMTNYISPQIVKAVEAMDKGGLPWQLTSLGTLATMNNGYERDDCPMEGFWEFGGSMMLGRHRQQNLFEVA